MQRLDLLFSVSIQDFREHFTGDAAVCSAVERALNQTGVHLSAYINGDRDLIVLSENGIARWRADVPQTVREFCFAFSGDLHLIHPQSRNFAGAFALDSDDKPCVALVGFTEKLRFTSY